MRHRVRGRRLSRPTGHRIALRRNLICALYEHERIRTTEAKARAIRGEAEHVITIAKRGLKRADMADGFDPDADHEQRLKVHHAWKQVMKRLNNKHATRKVFEELAPRYEGRPGGYTRILRLGPRRGDAASMVLIELVDE